MHAQRGERFTQARRQLHNLHGGLRSRLRDHAIESRTLGLHAGHTLHRLQAPRPRIVVAVKVHFHHIGAGHAVLEFHGSAQRHQLAMIHNGDAVAQLVGLIHVVRGEEHGEVARALELVEHLPYRDARNGVEAGGGLVQKKDARIVHQAPRDLEPAPHAAGKRFGLCIAPLGQIDGFEHRIDVLLALFARHAVKLGVDRQVFLQGQILVAGERLRNDADRLPHVIRVLAHVVPSHNGFARGDGDERGHHADECALAGAVRSQQTEDLALANAEVHVLDGFKVAVAFPDVLHRNGHGMRRVVAVCRQAVAGRAHCFTNFALGM